MKGSPARYFIRRMVRRIGRGYWIGDLVLILGITAWFSWSAIIGLPLCLLALLFLGITARYQIRAWLLVRALEQDGTAELLYCEMAEPESIHSPQTNTIITKSFIVSVGGKTGFSIIKNEHIVDAHIHAFHSKSGESKEIIIKTASGALHHVAFYHTQNVIPKEYDDVLAEILKRIPANKA